MSEEIQTIEQFFVGMKKEDFEKYQDNKSNSELSLRLRVCALNSGEIVIPDAITKYVFNRKYGAEQKKKELAQEYGIPLSKLHVYKITEILTKLDS